MKKDRPAASFRFQKQIIPARVFELGQQQVISMTDLLLLVVVDRLVRPQRAEKDGTGCYASNGYFAEHLGICQSYVSTRINHLRRQGLLLVVFVGDQRYLELPWSRTGSERDEIPGPYGEALRAEYNSQPRDLFEDMQEFDIDSNRRGGLDRVKGGGLDRVKVIGLTGVHNEKINKSGGETAAGRPPEDSILCGATAAPVSAAASGGQGGQSAGKTPRRAAPIPKEVNPRPRSATQVSVGEEETTARPNGATAAPPQNGNGHIPAPNGTPAAPGFFGAAETTPAHALSAYLFEGLADRGLGTVKRPKSFKYWDQEARLLLADVMRRDGCDLPAAEKTVRRLIDAFLPHARDKYFPVVGNMRELREKYHRIERALERDKEDPTAPPAIEVSPKAARLAEELSILGWAHGAAVQLPAVVEESLRFYHDFTDRLDAYASSGTDRKLVDFAAYVGRWGSGGAEDFVRRRLERVAERVAGWENWSGTIPVLKRRDKEFAKWGRDKAARSGDVSLWDRLLVALYDGGER